LTAVALETSSRRPSVAVSAAALVRERALAAERAHASDLLPALDLLLNELGVPPSAIEQVIVGTGPGSYTGLRAGIATALGLARASGAALRGVPSLEALAWGELAPGEACSVLLDARAGELYFASYRREADEVTALQAPRVVPVAEMDAVLERGATLFADEGAAALVRAAGRGDVNLVEGIVPRARALLELGLRQLARHGPQDPREIEPLYLRAFAARARRR